MGKMPHHGTNGKNDGNPADLDERTVKTVAKKKRLCEHGRTSGSAGIYVKILSKL